MNHTAVQRRGTHHRQDGVQDDVQLHHSDVRVVQDGPGQFKHAVIYSQVQVVQNVLVGTDFTRHPIYRNTVMEKLVSA